MILNLAKYQHNDTQQYNIKHNNTLHNDTLCYNDQHDVTQQNGTWQNDTKILIDYIIFCRIELWLWKVNIDGGLGQRTLEQKF